MEDAALSRDSTEADDFGVLGGAGARDTADAPVGAALSGAAAAGATSTGCWRRPREEALCGLARLLERCGIEAEDGRGVDDVAGAAAAPSAKKKRLDIPCVSRVSFLFVVGGFEFYTQSTLFVTC
jgi:hypothetical protein